MELINSEILKTNLPKDYPVIEKIEFLEKRYETLLEDKKDDLLKILRYVGQKEFFEIDLEFGQIGERFIRKFLELNGCKFVSNNNNKTHDFIMINKNGISKIYEVKTEVANLRRDTKTTEWFDTKNVAIEFQCNTKKSGIETTKSDFFISFSSLTGEIFFAKTNGLKKYISDNKNNLKIGIGGDNNSSHMYLIKREDYKKLDFITYVHLYKDTINRNLLRKSYK